MVREEFEKLVRQQIEARKPVKYPDEHTIQTAVTIFLEDLGSFSAPHCAAVAIRLAHAYLQEHQGSEPSTTPPQRRQGVIDAEDSVKALIGRYRELTLGTEAAYRRWKPEEVQAYLASPSAGDTLLSFCRDLASATKTTVSDVAMGVLAQQPLVLSWGNFDSANYSIGMPDGATLLLSIPTLEALTGNVLTHTWDNVLPGFRQHAGHTPRQHIQTTDDQEKKRAVQAFITAQQQAWGWTQGYAPKGFWPKTCVAWNKQCEQSGHPEWQYPSHEAMRKMWERLPDEQG